MYISLQNTFLCTVSFFKNANLFKNDLKKCKNALFFKNTISFTATPLRNKKEKMIKSKNTETISSNSKLVS